MAREAGGQGDRPNSGDEPEGGVQPQGGGKAGGEGGGEGGGGAGPQGGSGKPSVKRTLTEDVLPENLRGRPEHEIRFVLQNMGSALQTSNARYQQLEARLKELEGKNQPPPEPDITPDELKEKILEDPEGTIVSVVRKAFGGDLTRISSTVGETVFGQVAQEFDDFHEFEDDVRNLLEQSKTPITKENVMGAYSMAVGLRTLEERRRGAREEDNIDPPAPPKPEETESELTEAEEQVRRAFGWSKDQYAKAKKRETLVEVPTSGKS